ncbi:MAG: NAD(+) synthase [Bacilli bacterium]|nr:NAD(+) synthase [Bacilli bacterium]
MKVYNAKSDKPMTNKLHEVIDKIRLEKNFNAKKYVEEKAKVINEYMSKFNLKSCVVAISGGIDSAVVLGIINKAYKEKNSPIKRVIPLLLPITKSTGVTNQIDATIRGKELCDKLGLESYTIDLSRINTDIREDVEKVIGITGDDWAIGQLGPYSRTPILYYTTSLLCQEGLNAIICGTTNKDEGGYLGYIGKASDGMVDVQIISDIHKSEVYKVGEYLEIPKSIMEVTPSGDMYDNRSDETVFGAPYDFVELYLNYLNYDEKKKKELLDSLDNDSKEQFKFYANNLENLHKYNLHKYMGCSPAIHFDLWDSSVKGGWEGYYDRFKEIMNK